MTSKGKAEELGGSRGGQDKLHFFFFNVEGLMVYLCANRNISVEREDMNAARERERGEYCCHGANERRWVLCIDWGLASS